MASSGYKKSSYEYTYYCLLPERDALYEAINRRVDRMMHLGLVDEIERLLKRGLGPALRQANVIGYEELLDYTEERSTLEEAVEKIKQNSRRYAKRQITWFRHQIEGQLFTGGEQLRQALETDLRGSRAIG
jgi:tRNA dimethylallyltransferase